MLWRSILAFIRKDLRNPLRYHEADLKWIFCIYDQPEPPMKRPQTKAQARIEIEKQIEDFLKEGGQVVEVNQGTSALHNGELVNNSLGFEQPKQQRTPVPGVVAAIEAKRQAKLAKNQPKKRRNQRPRKKVIYDDFGEPVRVIWIED